MGSKVFITLEYWRVVFFILKIFNIHEDRTAIRVKSLQVLQGWWFRHLETVLLVWRGGRIGKIGDIYSKSAIMCP